MQARDLPRGLKQSNHYKAGLEVYAPNFLCRQFELVQMVPEINCFSTAAGTSHRCDVENQDVREIRSNLGVLCQYSIHQGVNMSFACTNHFNFWWEHQWNAKCDRHFKAIRDVCMSAFPFRKIVDQVYAEAAATRLGHSEVFIGDLFFSLY